MRTLITGAILAYFSIYYTCLLYASNILVDREFLLGEGTFMSRSIIEK